MRSIVQTPTNNLAESKHFYQKLNFEYHQINDRHYVVDGKLVIEINPDRFARAGVKIYKESWSAEVAALESFTTVAKIEDGYLLSDSSGVWIYLMEEELDLGLNLDTEAKSLLGNYSGMSLEGISIAEIYKVWSLLGFKITMGGPNLSWMVTENEDGLAISFMGANSCPHLFFNPSLTYFNGANNLNVIAKIQSLRIPITEEITHFNKEGIVDNIILRDPGGLGFFIFSD